ncbi:MAG: response regulator, partial [Bacteroidia bacterium]
MDETIHILLVEDNPADAGLIKIYLHESYAMQFSLSVAENLNQGLDLIGSRTFDVIIIDLSLPDSFGLNTFKDMYAAAPEIPIIVLTGNEDESVGINTVKMGAQDFLVKSKLSVKGLKQSINYSIERYKLLKSLSENAKKLEEKTADLLKEKHKLAQAQKLAQIGSWEWDVSARLFTCSDEFYDIFGVRPGEIIFDPEKFIDFIHPEERYDVKTILEESLRELKPFDLYHRIIRPDGAVRMLHALGQPLANDEGKAIRMVGTEQDVTQRQKEEQHEQLAMVAIKSYNAVT